jgi:hypothetical protein
VSKYGVCEESIGMIKMKQLVKENQPSIELMDIMKDLKKVQGMFIEIEKKLMKLEPKLVQDRGSKELDPNFLKDLEKDDHPNKRPH